MEKISYTVNPPVEISLQEWMAEFRIGIMAPKKDNRAKEIMDTWTVDHKPVDWKKYIQKKLEEWA